MMYTGIISCAFNLYSGEKSVKYLRRAQRESSLSSNSTDGNSWHEWFQFANNSREHNYITQQRNMFGLTALPNFWKSSLPFNISRGVDIGCIYGHFNIHQTGQPNPGPPPRPSRWERQCFDTVDGLRALERPLPPWGHTRVAFVLVVGHNSSDETGPVVSSLFVWSRL